MDEVVSVSTVYDGCCGGGGLAKQKKFFHFVVSFAIAQNTLLAYYSVHFSFYFLGLKVS